MTRVLTSMLLATIACAPGVVGGEAAPLGFFASSAESYGRAEAAFLETPDPARARRWLLELTEEPHVAGTPQERVVAEYVRERLEEFGLETEVTTYQVYLSHPKRVAARLLQPDTIELQLREDVIAEDKDSASEALFPGFHGYSASGQASGQVVYVNYGTPDDYRTLAEMDISVEGRIVLVRYGQVFRGLKVWQAEERGAIGVLIYSDPADDGYMKGDIYPDGPMRPPSAIQRGSVQYLSHQPGDPSTPGYPSRDDARRLTRAEMTGVPTIPSLPLSYREAEKILRHMRGERVPDAWQGGLPFAYHVGPEGAIVEMEVEMDAGLRTIYNVFGIVRGSDRPERWVILGNHRDAWNHGAVDPNSGTASWLETARGLAAAVDAGWRPRRTIILASWDAEEYGLVGSVEWGEDLANELDERTVAYINLDSAVTGKDLGMSGSPSLRLLARQSAATVADPVEETSVGQLWEQRMAEQWAKDSQIDLSAPEARFDLQLGALGSGSDYTVFLDHLGIAAIDFGFRGPYGVYHSAYDSFHWMEQFGDAGFAYHATAARLFGVLAMRLASADVLPFRFGSYSGALEKHLQELERKVVRLNRQASVAAPNGDARTLEVNFGPVATALESLGVAGARLDDAIDMLIERQDRAGATAVNDPLLRVERTFLSPDGLPGRPWFRHLLFAPGLTTGYGAWPFPELAEAVENRDPVLFEHGSERVVRVLEQATRELDEAVRLARSQSD